MNRKFLTALICAIGLSLIVVPSMVSLLSRKSYPDMGDVRAQLDDCQVRNHTRCYLIAKPVPRFQP